MYIEIQEDACNIIIDKDMEIDYESSNEDYNRDVHSYYTAQNQRIKYGVNLE